MVSMTGAAGGGGAASGGGGMDSATLNAMLQGGKGGSGITTVPEMLLGRLGGAIEQGLNLKKLGCVAPGGQLDLATVGGKPFALNPSILGFKAKPIKMYDGVPGGGGGGAMLS